MQNVVHWFLLLQDPVDFPPGTSWKIDAQQSGGLQFVSVAARQVQQRMRVLDEMGAMMAALGAAIPGSFVPTSTTSDDIPIVPATVMEIVAVFENVGPDELQLSAAFDLGLSAISRVARSYSRVTFDPIRIPARESLPPTIPMVTRVVTESDPGYPGVQSQFLPSIGQIRAMIRPPISNEQMRQIGDVYSRIDGVFTTYLDFALGAKRQLERDGDYAGSVLAGATAAEALLDDVLLHGSWESGRNPEDIAPMFSNTRAGIRARVPELAGLLGGVWNLDMPGALHDWQLKIAALRHRVVHGGYRPTLQEARSALEALQGLETFVTDSLTSGRNVKRLIFTTLSIVGLIGLERRKLLSKAIKTRLGEWTGPDQLVTFDRWRSAVFDERGRILGLMKVPDASSGSVFLVRRDGGTREWVLVDESSKMAALTADRTPDLPLTLRKTVTELLRVLDYKDAPTDVSSLIVGVRGGTPISEWLPVRHLLPLNGVMFDGSDQ